MYWFDNFPLFADYGLSQKQVKFLKENSIFVNLLIFLSSMFEYKDMSEDLRTEFIEYYNILSPLAASGVFRSDSGKEVVGYALEGGLLDDYLVPVKFNINTLGRNNKQGVIDGVNAAICWNNKTHTSDLITLRKYTELIHLCDTSQKCLMKYARLFPVFEVEDENVKDQIRNAVKNAEEGNPVTFTTKGLSRIGMDGEPGVKVVNLGNVNAVDKLQYLSTYHNDLLRRFFSMYGMAYSQSTKQAQQSIEEVHSENKISWIIPNDRLNERQKFIDKYNKVFKHNASVDYSQAWLDAYEEYMEGGMTNAEQDLERVSTSL